MKKEKERTKDVETKKKQLITYKPKQTKKNIEYEL